MKKIYYLFLILFTIITSGCSVFSINNSPTPWPTNYLSTAIALTMDAISQTTQATISFESQILTTELPEETPIVETEINYIQKSATPTPNAQRTPSPTVTPTNPEAVIQIVYPGSLSKVISPIKIEAYAQPGAENKVFIELIGENGQLIASEIRKYQNLSRLWAPVNLEFPFQLDQAAEYARLQIRTEDQFHRTIALSPIHLILQSNGINRIYPNTILLDRCVIHSPKTNEVIAGSLLIVDGEFLPFNDQPILIELTTETGNIINSKYIELQSASSDSFISFKIDLPFQVSNRTPVRMTISQKDERIPGFLYVYSQLLVIEP